MKELIEEALKQVEPKLEEKERLFDLKDKIMSQINSLNDTSFETKINNHLHDI